MERESENAIGAFLINGEPHYVPFPVINYKDEEKGYSFENPVDQKGCYGLRKDPSGNEINSIVLHWDVCDSARDCFRVLCQSELSAHIMIDEDGTVYQILDLIKLANHARGCNHNSIGIMLQNPVLPSKPTNNKRDYYESRDPSKSKTYLHLDFTEEQKKIVTEVCDALCKIFSNIPKVLPPLSEDDLITTAILPRHERVGILAHYNVQRNRLGPGDSLWVEFFDANFLIREPLSSN